MNFTYVIVINIIFVFVIQDCCTISHHTSQHTSSHHITSHHITWHHITSNLVTTHNIISHYVASPEWQRLHGYLGEMEGRPLGPTVTKWSSKNWRHKFHSNECYLDKCKDRWCQTKKDTGEIGSEKKKI